MFQNKYLTGLFLCLNITISYFILDNQTNGLLVLMLGTSPLFLIMQKRNYDNVDVKMILLLVLMFLFALGKPGFRIVSYLYSVCFVCSFLCLREGFKNDLFSLQQMQTILRNLLYAYCFVLILQQLCVIVGIKPINQTFGFADNQWKLPALAQEPSHMAIFVFFFMYGYILITETINGKRYDLEDAKQEKWVWFSYFWLMLTCQSTSAVFYCGLIFLRYFNKQSILKLFSGGIVALFVVMLLIRNTEAFQRAIFFSEALLTIDIETLDSVDHSAAYRFFPLFYLKQNFNIFDSAFWFGHGLDFGKNTLNMYALEISGDVTYNGEVNMGGFFGYIMDYGMICFCILCAALKKIIMGIRESWLVFFYVWLNLFIGFNMQLFWSSTLLLTFVSIHKENDCL